MHNSCVNVHCSRPHACGGLEDACPGYSHGCGAGVEYWLVKNEWSVHWGDKGYIKIAQEHDCAVATEAFFVTM